jgi:L-ascorbate metabolism protein UlaG (beta-lactamase superfamily)
VGHATALIDVGGHRTLTDPLLTSRVAHLRRRCPLPGDEVADVDLVVLSHAHIDHLHGRSLRRIRPDAHVVAPRGTAKLVVGAGLTNVVEVVPGDVVSVGKATIEVTTAVHGCGRGPHSRVTATPVGYVVDVDGHRTYFAGDTDLFDGMGGLRDIDVALIPIWGWGKTIGPGHLDPVRAAEATRRVAPRTVVPIHWGTYSPEDARRKLPDWLRTPGDRFDTAMSDADVAAQLTRLDPGGSVAIE